MTSQNRQRGTYVYAEDSNDAPADYEAARQRHATVYDAVAGRVSLKFSKDSAATGGSRKTPMGGRHHLGDPVLAPEEVLFSRRGAPQRYAEGDVYPAHEALPDGGRRALPDSDTVKAVHGYASHYYDALGRRHCGGPRGGAIGHVDERSMDGTALLAFGILLEEAARETLGREGDLVFTEGIGGDDDDDDDDGGGGDDDDEDVSRGRRTIDPGRPRAPVGFEGGEKFWRRNYAKRRKTREV